MRIKLLSICFISFQLGFSLPNNSSRIHYSILNLNKIVNYQNTSLNHATKIKYFVGTKSIEQTETHKLTLLPNPAKNEVKLNFNTDKSSFNIRIIDALGRTVKYLDNIKTGYILNTSHFLDGIYFVSFYNLKSKNVVTKKLIIQH